ncbi:hypothetical protein T459_29316 [Capsicum annuum]|uniref:F-box associated beta-propeller type 3 domain-containing protein n=1 Tax=Capsicum annuum TaxID=4072 RepID=A0A2G2Y5Q0_CAPAN|nr:hypothetical protein T459_29316 [Capsicum annuum]
MPTEVEEKKPVPHDQKDKGVLVSNNTEQMYVDVVDDGTKNDPNSQKLLICQWFPQDDTISIDCLNLSPSAAAQPVGNIRRLDFHSIYKPRRLHLACCCDGLAIIAAYYDIDVRQIRYLLWNPSTGESAPLPDPQFPDYSGIFVGLGYDLASGGYKIVATYLSRDCPGEILAKKSGCSWRYIDKHSRGIFSHNIGTYCLPFVNGAFHWTGMRGDYSMPSISQSVVSFSISNEVYGDIPLPEQLSCLQRRRITCVISALDGMLCVYSNSDLQGTFKLWVLKDYDVKG